VLDQEFRARFLADEATTLAVEGVSVRGVLFGLEDRPSDREKRFFSGELMDEAGKAWSIRFKVQLADEARTLWRKAVELVGRARYSKMRRPVLYVEHGQLLAGGAWQEALTRHRGSWRRLYQGMSMDDILRDLR
jgi:hypothetical protein